MLPFSLTDGWNVVGDNAVLTFESLWGDEHVVSSVEIDGDDIILRPTAGDDATKLVVRLDVFEQFSTRAILAAHTTPGADRG